MYIVSDLVTGGTLSRAAAKFLEALVVTRQPIMVIGEERSGKSTLVNALLAECSMTENVVLCDSRASLIPLSQHWTHVLRRPPAKMVELVQHAARTRPDRLVVDEIEDESILATLNAETTGILYTLRAADFMQAVRQVATFSGCTDKSALLRLTARVQYVVAVRHVKEGYRVAGIYEAANGEINPLLTYDPLLDALRWTGRYPQPTVLKSLHSGARYFNFDRDVVGMVQHG